MLDGDVDAGLLLCRGLDHERTAGKGAVGHADGRALLDDDNTLACAASLNSGEHASRASASDDDVGLQGVVSGLLALGGGGLGQSHGGAHGGDSGGACGGDEVATGHVHFGIPFDCGARAPICRLPGMHGHCVNWSHLARR